MSETMNIRFGTDMPLTSVEVIAGDLQVLHRAAMRAGSELDVRVPAADSFIRLCLPSGKSINLRHSGDLNYVVTRKSMEHAIARPQPEKLDVQSVGSLKHYNQTRSMAFSNRSGVRDSGSGNLGINSRSEQWSDPTLELPELTGGIQVRWSPEIPGRIAEDEQEIAFAPTTDRVPYKVLIQGPREFQVKLPGNVQAAYIRSDWVGTNNLVCSLRVATMSTDADTVGAYLMRGDYYSAESMAEWAAEAEQMLLNKMADPYAATVAAYLLLRLERYDQLHDWPRNLADSFPENPDGCFIWAAKSALANRDQDEAKKYIRKGMERGLPIYTEGLHMLPTILRRLGGFGQEILGELGKNTQGVVWGSPFTTLASGWSESTNTVSLDVAYAATL